MLRRMRALGVHLLSFCLYVVVTTATDASAATDGITNDAGTESKSIAEQVRLLHHMAS